MADETLRHDVNYKPVIGGVTDNAAKEIVQIKVAPITGRLLTDTDATQVGHTAVGSGTLYITAAGSVQQLPSVSCNRAFIQAGEGNTGVLCIGGNSVAATLEVRQGRCFYATQGDWFHITNLNLLYASSTVGGDGMSYFYEV